MYTQAPAENCTSLNDRFSAAARIRKMRRVLLTALLMTALCASAARAQVRAFKLQHGHISQLIVDQGAQLTRMVRVDASGQEVGKPFDVLVQHRSGPDDQAIDGRWARVDSLITCFPASIANPKIRAKAILNDEAGAIKIRRYASGIVIVEPGDGRGQPDPALLAGPVQ